LIAFTKDNLKARLAYSTVSQLSYIILAALLASSTAITGGALHIVMHGFAKITLFFCAGAILVATHKSNISELDGLGRKMPITMLAFTIGSLGIIGLPPASGLWSKLLIAMGTLDNGHIWLIATDSHHASTDQPYNLASSNSMTAAGWQEAPAPSLWAIVMTSSVVILLFFYPAPLLDLLSLIQWR